ncbi:hypothetical protein RBSH_03707 [Rhodopirellula baltica SH28]|uniref:Uncharacterized protein n=1 Tax=Rhodopirellula baltica SH28 TaxID=993517 RepID=K5DEY8_RHOBT|nr:hypothetical protein RBSH_03707 [Rhodopirellula baltica SH28]
MAHCFRGGENVNNIDLIDAARPRLSARGPGHRKGAASRVRGWDPTGSHARFGCWHGRSRTRFAKGASWLRRLANETRQPIGYRLPSFPVHLLVIRCPTPLIASNCSTLVPWIVGPASRWLLAGHERSSKRVEHLSPNVCVPGSSRRAARHGRVGMDFVKRRGLAAENCPTEQLGTTVLLWCHGLPGSNGAGGRIASAETVCDNVKNSRDDKIRTCDLCTPSRAARLENPRIHWILREFGFQEVHDTGLFSMGNVHISCTNYPSTSRGTLCEARF